MNYLLNIYYSKTHLNYLIILGNKIASIRNKYTVKTKQNGLFIEIYISIEKKKNN